MASFTPAEMREPNPLDDAVEHATAQLLIELAFLVPRHTDMRKALGPNLIAFKSAIREQAKADAVRRHLEVRIAVLDKVWSALCAVANSRANQEWVGNELIWVVKTLDVLKAERALLD